MAPRWTPPIEANPLEERVLARCKKCKLYIFLRHHRHEIFDDEVQEKPAAAFRQNHRARKTNRGLRCCETPSCFLRLPTLRRRSSRRKIQPSLIGHAFHLVRTAAERLEVTVSISGSRSSARSMPVGAVGSLRPRSTIVSAAIRFRVGIWPGLDVFLDEPKV